MRAPRLMQKRTRKDCNVLCEKAQEQDRGTNIGEWRGPALNEQRWCIAVERGRMSANHQCKKEWHSKSLWGQSLQATTPVPLHCNFRQPPEGIPQLTLTSTSLFCKKTTQYNFCPPASFDGMLKARIRSGSFLEWEGLAQMMSKQLQPHQHSRQSVFSVYMGVRT